MFKTYQMPWGFQTVDLSNGTPPDSFLAEFEITADDAALIEDGGTIEIIDGVAVVYPPIVLGEGE